MAPSQNRPPPHVLHLPLSVENFSRRVNLIRGVRKCRKKGIQSRQNNITLAIKQNQGLLVFPQGL